MKNIEINSVPIILNNEIYWTQSGGNTEDKIRILFQNKINELAFDEVVDPIKHFDEYIKSHNIREIARHYVSKTKRRPDTFLVHVFGAYYEIPNELFEKILVLGCFPP